MVAVIGGQGDGPWGGARARSGESLRNKRHEHGQRSHGPSRRCQSQVPLFLQFFLLQKFSLSIRILASCVDLSEIPSLRDVLLVVGNGPGTWRAPYGVA